MKAIRSLAPCFQAMQIWGLLICHLLLYGSTVVGCLSIFRDQVNIETIWAGCVDTDSRQLMPRQSFEAWRSEFLIEIPVKQFQVKLSQHRAQAKTRIQAESVMGNGEEKHTSAIPNYPSLIKINSWCSYR